MSVPPTAPSAARVLTPREAVAQLEAPKCDCPVLTTPLCLSREDGCAAYRTPVCVTPKMPQGCERYQARNVPACITDRLPTGCWDLQEFEECGCGVRGPCDCAPRMACDCARVPLFYLPCECSRFKKYGRCRCPRRPAACPHVLAAAHGYSLKQWGEMLAMADPKAYAGRETPHGPELVGLREDRVDLYMARDSEGLGLYHPDDIFRPRQAALADRAAVGLGGYLGNGRPGGEQLLTHRRPT